MPLRTPHWVLLAVMAILIVGAVTYVWANPSKVAVPQASHAP